MFRLTLREKFKLAVYNGGVAKPHSGRQRKDRPPSNFTQSRIPDPVTNLSLSTRSLCAQVSIFNIVN